jgi:hypothetical protein
MYCRLFARRMLLRMALVLAFFGGPFLCPSDLKADEFLFHLTTGNSGISPPYEGNYATVTVDLNSDAEATITFTSLTKDGNIYLMGAACTVGVNINATTWTLGTTITGSNSGTGFSTPIYSNGGAGNEDGFGSFNQRINSFDGFTHSSDTLSFTVTDTSSTWASAADVLTRNAKGNIAAAHIFVTPYPANANTGALTTGYAASDGSDGVIVPEPSSALLLSLGVLALGGYTCCRQKRLLVWCG